MAQISHVDKEIKLKLVYYGPALSGKTTNLIYVHQVLFPNQKVKLFSINTGDDRTLFFDLLPLDLGIINGFSIKMQLFTVPGQVRYNQTRRTVLNKADGVVFVADSTRSSLEENRASYENMLENLKVNRLNYSSIPLVLQFNKQDKIDIYSTEEMNGFLNERKVPSFGASAVSGPGVLETLKYAILEVLNAFNKDFPDFSVSTIEDKIDRSFDAVQETYQRKTRVGTAPEEEPPTSKLTGGGAAHNVKVIEHKDDISQAKLLEKAVETNIEMVELYNELNAAKNQLEQRNREFTILGQINQALTEKFDPENLPRLIFKSILLTFQTTHGSLLEFDRNANRLRESYISGFQKDPLAGIRLAGDVSFADQLFSSLKPICFNIFSYEDQPLSPKQRIALADELKRQRVMAFLSVPIHSSGQQFGLLTVYQMINESSVLKAFTGDDLVFLSRLATVTSLSFEKKAYNRRLLESARESETRSEKTIVQLKEEVKSLWLQNQDTRIQLENLRVLMVPVLRMDMLRESLWREVNSGIGKPLSSMQMAGRILDKVGTTNLDNLEKVIGVYREETQKLASLLDRLKLAAPKYLQPSDFIDEDFPVHETVNEVRNAFGGLVAARNLEWKESVPDGLPLLHADKDKIRFLISEIVSNAIRNTEGGFVEISVTADPMRTERFLLFTCSDSGRGIDKNIIPTIFDRHARRPDEISNHEHFGIGLTICKEIVEHYGGKLSVRSEVGFGSVFSADIPVQFPTRNPDR